ncbi:DUF423 domain-containing protein [Archangium lipolyticum]|uniref:DUF423 domain-containing protein n=1 Tax=Archangium lipolyticum TaxID=2970465 RepID=UPI00214A1AFC|nr:DUF423 domain-containing protein [Archangium lipolyticum]
MRLWLILGAASAFISVAAGAFGAHALKARLSPDLLTIFETGARYQMYHSLGLIAMGLLMQLRPNPLLNAAGWAMLAGIVLFSGSLYALALSGVRVLGAITPFGGVGFLVGWVLFALAAWRQTG